MKHRIVLIGLVLILGCSDNRDADQIIQDIKISLEHKDFQEARKDINTLLRRYKKSSIIYYYDGLVCMYESNYQEALQSFHKSIELDRSCYQSFIARGQLKNLLGDYYGAISDLNTARLIKKDEIDIYRYKAVAFEKLEDLANAIIQYETAISFGLNDGESYYKLGLLYLRTGKPDDACLNFRIAGDMGYLKAFGMIKSNCHNKTSQFLFFENRFCITFPDDIIVDRAVNNDSLLFFLVANGIDPDSTLRFLIAEVNPSTFLGETEKINSIFNIPISSIIGSIKYSLRDFDLIISDTTRINGNDCYFIKYSTTGLKRDPIDLKMKHTIYLWNTYYPAKKRMYFFYGYCNMNGKYDEERWKHIFIDIKNSVSFL